MTDYHVTSQIVVSTHLIRDISHCCPDIEDPRVFAYMTKDKETDCSYCHVFMVESKVRRRDGMNAQEGGGGGRMRRREERKKEVGKKMEGGKCEEGRDGSVKRGGMEV